MDSVEAPDIAAGVGIADDSVDANREEIEDSVEGSLTADAATLNAGGWEARVGAGEGDGLGASGLGGELFAARGGRCFAGFVAC